MDIQLIIGSHQYDLLTKLNSQIHIATVQDHNAAEKGGEGEFGLADGPWLAGSRCNRTSWPTTEQIKWGSTFMDKQ